MFGTAPVGRLSLRMDQRSADAFLGVPYNIASYALLTHMLAQQCNMLVGDLIIHFGDLHLYQNHIHPDIVFSQLAREPMPLPQLALNRKESIFDYTLADCKLVGYNPWPAIKAPIAV
jgi:thymidylate synthase